MDKAIAWDCVSEAVMNYANYWENDGNEKDAQRALAYMSGYVEALRDVIKKCEGK